jgi:hypothetical protein
MALERKDVRAKLDAEMHQWLTELSEADGIDIGEFVEAAIGQVVLKRLHDAHRIAKATPTFGKTREKPGISGSGRE